MISKRGSRWRVVVQAGRDPLTRRRLQLSGSAASEREAVRLERGLRLQVGEPGDGDGDLVPGGGGVVGEPASVGPHHGGQLSGQPEEPHPACPR